MSDMPVELDLNGIFPYVGNWVTTNKVSQVNLLDSAGKASQSRDQTQKIEHVIEGIFHQPGDAFQAPFLSRFIQGLQGLSQETARTVVAFLKKFAQLTEQQVSKVEQTKLADDLADAVTSGTITLETSTDATIKEKLRRSQKLSVIDSPPSISLAINNNGVTTSVKVYFPRVEVAWRISEPVPFTLIKSLRISNELGQAVLDHDCSSAPDSKLSQALQARFGDIKTLIEKFLAEDLSEHPASLNRPKDSTT